MELITLDQDLQGAQLIENWDSLVWAERFNATSDFQLTTGRVEEFLTLLPEGRVVSLRESAWPMVVETHVIEEKKNTPAKLTITGRAFNDWALDKRACLQSVSPDTGSGNWTVNVKTPSDAAHYIIAKICVEGILSPNDVFPASGIQFITPDDYLKSTGPTKPFDISRGKLLAIVQGLLQTETRIADVSTVPPTPAVIPHGIKAVRPNSDGTAVGVVIYTGIDRTDQILFDSDRKLLEDGTYVFSKVGSANAAYGVGTGVAARMFEGAVEPSGFARNVILVDASTAGIADPVVLRTEVSQSLSEARETASFNGSINEDISPYVYGKHYGLGDVVKVVGKYGLVEKARVTEYLRTHDNTGQKSYPTLTALPE